MIKIGKYYYAKIHHVSPDDTPGLIINNILDYLAQIDIVEVVDPGGPNYNPEFPKRIKDYIKVTKSFPCDEIKQATKDLRR